jgi:hypothetical protein
MQIIECPPNRRNSITKLNADDSIIGRSSLVLDPEHDETAVRIRHAADRSA